VNTRVRRTFAALTTSVILALVPACSSSDGGSNTSTTKPADAPRATSSTDPAQQPDNKFAACGILTKKQLEKVFDGQKFKSVRNEEEASMALAMDMTYHPQMCTFGEPIAHQDVVVTTRVMYAGCETEACLAADFKKLLMRSNSTDGQTLPLNTLSEDDLIGIDRATLHFYKTKTEDGYCLTCEGDLTINFMFTYGNKRYFVAIGAWARPQQLLDLTNLVMHSPKIAELA